MKFNECLHVDDVRRSVTQEINFGAEIHTMTASAVAGEEFL